MSSRVDVLDMPPLSLHAGNDWRFGCFWLLWLYFGSEREEYQSLSPDLFRFSAGDKGGGFARAAMHRRKPRAIGRWPQGAAIILPCRTGIGSHCNGRPVG